MSKKEVQFECSLNPHRQVIKIDGEGQSEISFTVDATQLAPVLSSMAQFKGRLIVCTLSAEGGKYGAKKVRKCSQVIR